MSDITTREQIVSSVDKLFYEQGYEHTSFSAIANAVKISRGNFYYHFKTKDEILSAVIQLRLLRTQQMLNDWETASDDALERVRSFIELLVMQRSQIKKFGCPVGSLCTELARLNHPARVEANQVFTLFRVWLCRQFTSLGFESDADELAMHLLSRSQGVATLASVFRDEQFISNEVAQIHLWLDSRVEAQAA